MLRPLNGLESNSIRCLGCCNTFPFLLWCESLQKRTYKKTQKLSAPITEPFDALYVVYKHSHRVVRVFSSSLFLLVTLGRAGIRTLTGFDENIYSSRFLCSGDVEAGTLTDLLDSAGNRRTKL